MSLFPTLPKPPSLLARGIDLRCCDTVEMMASLPDGCAALVVADPPWLYARTMFSHGEATTRPDDTYGCLEMPAIAAHITLAARLSSRLALWVTCPLLGGWMAHKTPWGWPVTSGAWVKSGEGDTGHYGQGFHWAGCAELTLIYTRDGSSTDRAQYLRNAWVEPPEQHSRKPARWMQQWIRRWVPPGGLVVDVYAGLGSVAEAVMLAGEGRRYVGAEIDPERHAQALSLLAQVRADAWGNRMVGLR